MSMGMTVSEINIYPVKGLAGIALRQAQMTTRGLKNDRRFMLVDPDHQFVSQRELPKMATVWTALIDGQLEFAAPDREPVCVDAEPRISPTRMVQIWSASVAAHTVSAEADEWLSDYLGADLRLVYMPESSERACKPEYATNNEIVSFADGFPVLITNAGSLDDLNNRIVLGGGTAIPMNRFRSNLVVKGAEPWAEDNWGEIEIGDAVFRAAKPCGRCQVTTTDQATGELRGPEPLKTLSGFRDTDLGTLFGVNLLPVKLGAVQVGDKIKLK